MTEAYYVLVPSSGRTVTDHSGFEPPGSSVPFALPFAVRTAVGRFHYLQLMLFLLAVAYGTRGLVTSGQL
jgi:hypothetical protein